VQAEELQRQLHEERYLRSQKEERLDQLEHEHKAQIKDLKE